MPRTAHIHRETAETVIDLVLNLDGTGKVQVSTGVGFFDHMLTHIGRHGLFDLTVKAVGDLHIDAHQTVEDIGICYGKALVQALGDKSGIRRSGDAMLPMDETLVTAAADLSGEHSSSGEPTSHQRRSADFPRNSPRSFGGRCHRPD